MLAAVVSIAIKLIFGTAQYIGMSELNRTATFLDEDPTKTIKFRADIFLLSTSFTVMFLFMLSLLQSQWPVIKQQRRLTLLMTALPGAMDVLSMFLAYSALKKLNASVLLLMKGSRVIFTATLSYILLRTPLTKNQQRGVLLIAVSFIPIALESFFDKKNAKTNSLHGSAFNVILGFGYALACELSRAVRFSFDEKLMKQDQVPIKTLLVCESFFACLISLLALLGGHLTGLEDAHKSFQMVKNSQLAQIIITSLVLVGVVCSIAGVLITCKVSSIVNAFVSEVRVILVFFVGVIINALDPTRGEKITKYSPLKLLGFLGMATALWLYGKKSATHPTKRFDQGASEPTTKEIV